MTSALSNKKPGPRTFIIGAAVLLIVIAVAIFMMLTSTAPADKNNEEMITITIEQGKTPTRLSAN